MEPASLSARSSAIPDRSALVARAKRLEYFTIAWNGFEAAVALVSGLLAGSVALTGFGLDSLIETASAMVLLWRLNMDHAVERREQAERRAHRVVGICFLLLGAYIAVESLRVLWMRERSAPSLPGFLIALAAVIVMPMLGRAKRRIATELGSRALHSDSRQADFCAYLSAILLVGLLLQKTVRLVVGRSRRGFDHGSHHRARRTARLARRRLR
jgi:divalent metal cation (Fe/Co/Zn/Cd) transporter